MEPIVIEILGTNLKVNTDEDPRYISQLIEYLREKTAEVQASARIEDPLKISILTSIYLIDELYKKSGSGIELPGDREASQLTLQMIEKLDQSLDLIDSPENPD
jgi:cell division protein ZapA